MINEAKSALKAPKKKAYTLHLIMHCSDPQKIVLPLCIPAEPSPAATSNWRDVTCVKCLEILQELSSATSYIEALNVVTPKAVIPQTYIDALKPTCDGDETQAQQKFCGVRGIASPQDLPKYMIGDCPATFWRAMNAAGLIDDEGNVRTQECTAVAECACRLGEEE